MKYRIKIISYKSGRIAYFAQKKEMFSWRGIGYDGETFVGFSGECKSREDALKRIDLNYAGNTKESIIRFEYITK